MKRGPFTGAIDTKQGRFERADGGTLFLDEVSEIEPAVQVKILRVLEERAFERVGGQKTIQIDTRLITATNRNLKEMVDQKEFREDLFFRLDVIRIDLPPLRNRGSDVALLLHHYLEEFARENNKTIEGFTSDALDTLQTYAWPGNVRELRNAVERMVVLTRSPKLTVRDIPPHLREGIETSGTKAASAGSVVTMEDAEKEMIISALNTHNGSRTKAAEQLGISRRTLHRKLNEYNLRDL